MRVPPLLLTVLLLPAAPGCKPMLYPVARAFGSPSEASLRECRAAFARLKAGRDLPLTVHPAVDPRRPGIHRGSGRAAVARLRAAGWTGAELAPQAPPVEPLALGRNQMRYLWNRAGAYGRWLASAPPAAGGPRMFLEVLAGPDGRVGGAHLFVLEPSGRVAYARLMNSHHFGPTPPADPTAAVELLVAAFLRDLERRPEEVFPPWGVG